MSDESWPTIPERLREPDDVTACGRCGGIGRIEGPMKLDYADVWDCPDCDGAGQSRGRGRGPSGPIGPESA